MRKAFKVQPTFDCPPPDRVPLNFQCRDEIVPILRGLQHIYSDVNLRGTILALVGKDVNRSSSKNLGRKGLDYWEIAVLGAVRLGCNFDYDKLQNMAEEHRTLRLLMGIGSSDLLTRVSHVVSGSWLSTARRTRKLLPG